METWRARSTVRRRFSFRCAAEPNSTFGCGELAPAYRRERRSLRTTRSRLPRRKRARCGRRPGTAGLEMNVAIPMLPNATGVAFSLRPSTEHVIFTLDEATLSALPEAVAGFTVDGPSPRGTRGASVPFDRKTREMYYTTAPADDVLVGNFTYDVNWNAAGAPHWKANGFQNAWVLPRGKRVAVTYDVQRLFATLQMAFIAFLAITFGLWIVARIGWIRQRRKETL